MIRWYNDTINAQIKEAESTFRLAGAGVQNYEKTVQNSADHGYYKTFNPRLLCRKDDWEKLSQSMDRLEYSHKNSYNMMTTQKRI